MQLVIKIPLDTDEFNQFNYSPGETMAEIVLSVVYELRHIIPTPRVVQIEHEGVANLGEWSISK